MRKTNLLFTVVLFCFMFVGVMGISTSANGQIKLGFLEHFNQASAPTKTFSTPSARVLNSMEVMVNMGRSFGVEESDGFLGKIAIGLGGIAEIELTRSSFVDNLTGNQKSFPSSVFKMSLVPQQLANKWYIPNLSLQLHSTPWRSNVDPNTNLQQDVRQADFLGNNLSRMNMDNRFTTLYGIIGKDFRFIQLHGGVSLTDVRVRNGYQWIFHQDKGYDVYEEIPDLQKNLINPFGSVSIFANEDTRLLAELQAIPFIDYNIKTKKVEIKKTWQAIVGVRFFIKKWISLDTGVKYLSSAKGIADSEVNFGFNFVLPLKNSFSKK
jgi:hypothetical protein